MTLDRFWQLLAKKLAGEATEQEILELEEIIKSNSDLSFAGQHVTDIWHQKAPEQKRETELAFEKLAVKLDLPIDDNCQVEDDSSDNQVRRKKTIQKWVGVLSILTIIAAPLFYFIWAQNKSVSKGSAKTQIQEISTRPGSRTKVGLPDGSTVWLNAGSKLTYDQPFGEKTRSVTLTGEAYFDVVKNGVPFVVHTNGASIKVLGTAFNVKSYPSEKKVETSLVHGRLEVTIDRSPESKYLLKPSQKLVLNTEEVELKKARQKQANPIAVVSTIHYLDNNTIAETSWVENKLVFDDETFEEISKKMERWYGVSIQLRSEKLKRERLTGVFEKETVSQALSALQLTTPFRFSIRNNEIIITH